MPISEYVFIYYNRLLVITVFICKFNYSCLVFMHQCNQFKVMKINIKRINLLTNKTRISLLMIGKSKTNSVRPVIFLDWDPGFCFVQSEKSFNSPLIQAWVERNWKGVECDNLFCWYQTRSRNITTGQNKSMGRTELAMCWGTVRCMNYTWNYW